MAAKTTFTASSDVAAPMASVSDQKRTMSRAAHPSLLCFARVNNIT